MTRDYAKRNTSRTRSNKKRPYLSLWLLVLCLFAVFVGSLVYLGKHNKHMRPIIQPVPPTETIPIKSHTPSEKVKEITAPKFDFYTMLPQRKNRGAVAEYELEIATVKDYAAADRLKAELALLGFSVSITPIQEHGLHKYYVTVGPYDNKDGAMSDLERLKQNKITSKLKKMH